MVGQFVGFLVVLAGDVLDGEINRTCQFAAGPVQGMQTGAMAGVLTMHLLDHYLGVGINAQRPGLHGDGVLQDFQQSNIFGDIVVLMPNRFGNSSLFSARTLNHDSNARPPGISVRAAVHIGHEISIAFLVGQVITRICSADAVNKM
jgi:hypothetical protein